MIRRATNTEKNELEIYRLDELGERQNGGVRYGVDSVMWTIISINHTAMRAKTELERGRKRERD